MISAQGYNIRNSPLPWQSSGTWASCRWSRLWWKLSWQTAAGHKSKTAELQNTAKVPENTAPTDMVQPIWGPARDKPWWSRSSWSRTRQTGRGEPTLARTGWTWRWPPPQQWNGCGPRGHRCPVVRATQWSQWIQLQLLPCAMLFIIYGSGNQPVVMSQRALDTANRLVTAPTLLLRWFSFLSNMCNFATHQEGKTQHLYRWL